MSKGAVSTLGKNISLESSPDVHFSLQCLSRVFLESPVSPRHGHLLPVASMGNPSPGLRPRLGQLVEGGVLALDRQSSLSITLLTGFPDELQHTILLHSPDLQFPLINDCKLLSKEPLDGAAITNGWEWN